ncbi:MAG: PaaI family thioesterase [Oscillospiraceae bacterium]|nr:PaaI family thioesterase [Oscillospiraceae bacterium]
MGVRELEGIEKLIDKRFGIRYLRAENGEAEAEMTLREDDRNAYGIPFGGLLFNLADCAAGAAVRSLELAGMTVSGEARFLRGSKEARRLLARARVRKAGRSLCFVDASVEDENGLELAAFSFEFMVRR